MLGKIIKSTKRKPCSCPEGKKCTACAETKSLKPRFCVETSKSPPPVPIVISHFRKNSNTVRIKDSLSLLKPLKKETRGRGSSIRQWYKKRRARSEQKNIQKIQQDVFERTSIHEAYREREKELLEQIKTQKKRKEPKAKSTNTTKIKNYVVHVKHRDPLRVRCANWWYRACCKFFCCLSCVLIISFVIVFIIPLVS